MISEFMEEDVFIQREFPLSSSLLLDTLSHKTYPALPLGLWIAPMAGVSDRAFRQLCYEAGADVGCTEMISALGLAYSNEATRSLMARAADEPPLVVQLFGHDPKVLAREAAAIEDTMGSDLAAIDVNMGCPARKIISKGDGSALLKEPERAVAIVKALVQALDHPVTVKARKGFDPQTPSILDVAPMLEQAGACALTIHGRYGVQGYKGSADWSIIGSVKTRVSIPIIGNGDITDWSTALRLSEATGCDGLMIGRGAIGAPWLFTQIKAALSGDTPTTKPDASVRIATAIRHCQMVARLDPDHLLRMRKIAPRYIAGLPGAAKTRADLCQASTLTEFEAVLQGLASSLMLTGIES